MPPFFGKDMRSLDEFWKIIFALAVPLLNLSPPKNRDFDQFFVISNDWGFWEKEVGRQEKSVKNVRNEHIDLPLDSWVRIIACLTEIRFSKLKILQNQPYFARLQSPLPKSLT